MDDLADANFARSEVEEAAWRDFVRPGRGYDGHTHTAPVHALPVSPYGIRGALGNVAEWIMLPAMLKRGNEVRAQFIGGSWANPPINPARGMRAIPARRPGFRRTDIGFRVALELGLIKM